MAVPFRLESVGIRKRAGQAKVLGTIISVSGAMLMTFYKGKLIKIGESGLHWKLAEKLAKNSSNGQSSLLGPLLVIVSCIAWAAWFILQAQVSKTFNAPYTSTALMCFFASIECAVLGFSIEHNIKEWSLASGVRLLGALYNGIVASALTFFLMSWCVATKGPLYVSAFAPLLLVIVAVFGWAALGEKLHVGSVVGSILIVAGLYIVLWGKDKEEDQTGKVKDEENTDEKKLEEKADVEKAAVEEKADVENAKRIEGVYPRL